MDCKDEKRQTNQRNYQHCKVVRFSVPFEREESNWIFYQKKSTVNKIRERYADNSTKYLQYK